MNFEHYQSYPDFDILFALNDATESFYETDYFPARIESLRYMDLALQDHLENCKQFGDYGDDDYFTVCTKSGLIYDVNSMTPAEFGRRIKRPFDKTLLFILYENGADTEFWVNGFEGLEALQQYTGWFDMDIYTDWI